MRFGFHFNGCALLDKDGIRVRGQFGPFVDALACEVDHIDLVLDTYITGSETSFEGQIDYQIKAQNISLVPLGPHVGQRAFQKRWLTMRHSISEARQNWDFILLREPSRRSPFIRQQLRKTPVVFLLGADFTNNLHMKNGMYIYLRSLFFTMSLRKSMRNSIVFVNNEVLLEEWRRYAYKIILTQTSTLSINDIISHPYPKFKQKPYKLLFIGRIAPVKGIDVLLHALAELKVGNELFRLIIVGTGPKEYLEYLYILANKLGVENIIEWKGYQPYSNILQFYRDADVFVSPARYEDIARTLWEAMSQGCPVITTYVGGQARLFKHNLDLLFCEPEDSHDLAFQIQRLTNDSSLRKQLVKRGLELASANTLEIRSHELIQNISNLLEIR